MPTVEGLMANAGEESGTRPHLSRGRRRRRWHSGFGQLLLWADDHRGANRLTVRPILLEAIRHIRAGRVRARDIAPVVISGFVRVTGAARVGLWVGLLIGGGLGG